MSDLDRIARGLRRRSLWQILALYLVVSWISLEVVTTLTEALGLPEWAPAFGFALLVLGFPIVLAVALVEGRRGDAADVPGPHADAPGREGDRRAGLPDPGSTDPAREGSEGPGGSAVAGPRRVFTWRNAALGGFGALGFWVLATIGGSFFGPSRATGDVEERRAIAALPFANLSTAEEDRYFADGIHEEILTQLARIDALRVISRTSVMGYRDSDRRLGEIAAELGVRYVLEGSVRRGGDHVRVTAQLIDAATDEHLWAETYDRPRADLLAIQSDVARRIAEALQAELSPEERRRIDTRATEDPEAYDLFLRARDLYWSGSVADREEQNRAWRRGVGLLQRAVERDPGFALAWSLLAVHHIELVWFGHDLSDSRRESALRAAERALLEDPDLPEAHRAMGWVHYHGRRDYDAALREARIAQRGLPGDPEVLLLIAAVERRRGNIEEAYRRFEEAFRSDPRNPSLAWEAANTAIPLRRFDDAERWTREMGRLAPEWGQTYMARVHLALSHTGDTVAARRAYAEWEGLVDPAGHPEYLLYGLAVDIMSRAYRAALERLEPWSSTEVHDLQDDVFSPALMRGRVLTLLGRSGEAEREHRAAVAVLRDWTDRNPGYPGPLLRLAEAHASLGNRAEALDAIRRARVLLPVERDRWTGPMTLRAEVVVRILLGDHDQALSLLERLVGIPSPDTPTPAILRIDPVYDAVRADPRFRTLLEAEG